MSIDVADWLRGLGLEQYDPAFRDNDIDGEVLRRLTAEVVTPDVSGAALCRRKTDASSRLVRKTHFR